jgi:hypothetical protein
MAAGTLLQTTDNTAVVCTAILVKYGTDRLEWALYQFSMGNPVRQLQTVLVLFTRNSANFFVYYV